MDVVLHRWGRLVQPSNLVGAYLLVEPETRDEGYPKPPSDALRVWQRRPGVPDDHDDNCSTWITSEMIPQWFGPDGFEVAEWLPEGVEPDWDGRSA